MSLYTDKMKKEIEDNFIKLEKAKEIIFGDNKKDKTKIFNLKELFDRINDIKDRRYVEGSVDCRLCGFDNDNNCDLDECCYLEGSIYWDERGYLKSEREEEEEEEEDGDNDDDW